MRTVVVMVAVLAALGLAAIGVVAARNGSLPALSAPPAVPFDEAKIAPAAPPAHGSPVREVQGSTIIPADPAPPSAPTSIARVTQALTPAAPERLVQSKTAPTEAAATATDSAAAPALTGNIAACDKPGGMGLSRIVEIDTAGGPGFGFEHFKQLDFLRDHEVVLTFDDGPWLLNTPSVLKTLADECTTGIFFPIGKHATYYPEILKEVLAAGHTVGSHTWSHATLTNKKLTEDQRKEEIEKGFSAVKWALGGVSPAPFFRFPALQHPPEMVTYLGTRNVAMFSCDLDSFDFKARNAQQVIDVTMKKLDKLGKGIILMHDFHKHTAEALPELMHRLKAGGYKVVKMIPKAPVQTLPQYDDEVLKDAKLPTVSSRPVSSVVQTISE